MVNDCSGTEAAALATCDTWGSSIATSDADASRSLNTWNYQSLAWADADNDGVDDAFWGSIEYAPPGAASAADDYGAVFVVRGPSTGTVDMVLHWPSSADLPRRRAALKCGQLREDPVLQP